MTHRGPFQPLPVCDSMRVQKRQVSSSNSVLIKVAVAISLFVSQSEITQTLVSDLDFES